MIKLALASAALLAAAPAPYIEALYPLQQFINEAEAIAQGTIEKIDEKGRLCIVRISKSIKGKCAYEQVRMNVGAGREWHPEAAMKHLAVGAPALFFYSPDRRGEIYINRFFMQLIGDAAAPPDKAWWTFTHIEIRCNRTYYGTAEELTRLVGRVLSGKEKAPPPDPKIPAITKEHVAALPAWGAKDVDPASLPPSFRARPPMKPRDPDRPAGAVPGVKFEYYEGAWTSLPDFGALKPVQSGVAAQFDLSKCARQENVALRFTGYIEIPKDGTYIFTTVSDEGSALRIGDIQVVGNDGLHGPVEAAGDIPLKAGRHRITVAWFEAGGAESLAVLYEGPGIARQAIPATALFHDP